MVSIADFLKVADWRMCNTLIARMKLFASHKKINTAEQIMTTPVIVGHENMLMTEAFLLFAKNGINHLPLVGEKGELVGILTRLDLLSSLYGDIGTGVGPFLSILATDKPWQRFERVVLVYAVRILSDLSYQERISQISAKQPGQFIFIPFLSREPSDFALPGRIPQAISDGRLEAHAGIRISAENSQIMLCGNPQMVKDTTNALIERGLKKHHRFDHGQITAENYW